MARKDVPYRLGGTGILYKNKAPKIGGFLKASLIFQFWP
jgi:hypothetical protein